MIDLVLDERPIQLSLQGATDAGVRRTENQDHFLVADLSATDLETAIVLSPACEEGVSAAPAPLILGRKGFLMIVADGMGGAAAGSIASKMATAWIHEELSERWANERENTPDRFIQALRESVEVTNSMLHQQSERYSQYRGMGTTATVAGVLGDYLYLAQVGDSRAYLIREGVATQLTRDQSLVQELIEAGALSEADAESSEHRNIILQALGVAPTIDVDITYQPLRRDDILLLCSDGLSKTVDREEIAGAVMASSTPFEICNRLVALANERGGPDNVTVIAARFEGVGLQPPQPTDRVQRRPYEN